MDGGKEDTGRGGHNIITKGNRITGDGSAVGTKHDGAGGKSNEVASRYRDRLCGRHPSNLGYGCDRITSSSSPAPFPV